MSVALFERLYPNGHARRAVGLSTLALVFHKQGNSEEARAVLQRAEEMALAHEPPTGPLAQRILAVKQQNAGE